MVESKAKLVDFFKTQENVAAVYLFGSHAEDTANDASDIDLGILLKRGLSQDFYADQQLYLGGKLCEVLNRDDVDVVILNRTLSSELKFSIIHDGEVIYDKEPGLVEYELRIKHEYHDHIASLKRAGYKI